MPRPACAPPSSIGEFGPARKVPRPKKSRRKLRARASRCAEGAERGLFRRRPRRGVRARCSARHPAVEDAGRCASRWRASRLHRRCTRTGCYVAVASSEPSAAAGDATYACCTFRGSVAALDIATGRMLWKSYLVNEEPRPYGKTAGGHTRIRAGGRAGSGLADRRCRPRPGVRGDGQLVSTAIEQPLADAVVAFSLADGSLRWAKKPVAEGGRSRRIRLVADPAHLGQRQASHSGGTTIRPGRESRSRSGRRGPLADPRYPRARRGRRRRMGPGRRSPQSVCRALRPYRRAARPVGQSGGARYEDRREALADHGAHP